MGAFPVITPSSTSSVTITTASSSLSYQQVLFNLYTTVYNITRLYLKAPSNHQVSTVFTLSKPKPDGTVYTKDAISDIDPNQFQPIVDVKMAEGDMQLDALTTLAFTLEPGAYFEMYFSGTATSSDYLLNNQDDDNDDDGGGAAGDDCETICAQQEEGNKEFLLWLLFGASVALLTAGIIKGHQQNKK